MLVNKMLKPVRLQLYSGLELEQKEDVLRESVIVQQHAITRMKKEYELKDQLVCLKVLLSLLSGLSCFNK